MLLKHIICDYAPNNKSDIKQIKFLSTFLKSFMRSCRSDLSPPLDAAIRQRHEATDERVDSVVKNSQRRILRGGIVGHGTCRIWSKMLTLLQHH